MFGRFQCLAVELFIRYSQVYGIIYLSEVNGKLEVFELEYAEASYEKV